MDRIIDIETDDRHLHRLRGFMVVSEGKTEVGRVPLDEILAVIIHAHGVTYSNSLLVELARRGALVVLCSSNHQPQAILWPLDGHHAQGARLRAQWNAPKPSLKQLWKTIVIAKIRMQAAALDSVGANASALELMVRRVKSGDPENVEAQAARRYWPLLFGISFRRDRTAGGPNAMLNYGYTVLRAATIRAVVASGLHPTIGLHHSNRGNAFALADDLMEPFRPLVDCTVRGLLAREVDHLDKIAKEALVRLIAVDLDFGENRSPVSVTLNKLAHSVAVSFETGKVALALPKPPTALEFAGLGSA